MSFSKSILGIVKRKISFTVKKSHGGPLDIHTHTHTQTLLGSQTPCLCLADPTTQLSSGCTVFQTLSKAVCHLKLPLLCPCEHQLCRLTVPASPSSIHSCSIVDPGPTPVCSAELGRNLGSCCHLVPPHAKGSDNSSTQGGRGSGEEVPGSQRIETKLYR